MRSPPGALTAMIVLGKITDYWRSWVATHGDPLANLHIGFEIPTIVVGGSSAAINWAQLGVLAIIGVVALAFVYAVWRLLVKGI